MVARLCERGWSVVVCDVDLARQRQALAAGSALADSPAAAARALDADGVLIVCVVNAEQRQEVLFGEYGAGPALRSGQTVMLCPTIAAQDIEALSLAIASGASAASTRRCRAGRHGRATAA